MDLSSLSGRCAIDARGRRTFQIIFSTLAAALAAVSAAGATHSTVSGEPLLVDPRVVTARLFYHGQSVRVSCTVPPDHGLAIVISGDGHDPVELKVRGRILGALWANVGEVTLDSIPSLYLAATSTDLCKLGDAAVLDGLAVGYGALQSRSRMSPAGAGHDGRSLFMEFVKLKEREELYAIDEGGVRLRPDGAGNLRFSTDFFIPPDVPQGRFDVRLLTFAKGSGKLFASADLNITQAGFVAWISSLARERGSVYGLLSVMVALAAGLLTGVVFDLGSKGGH